MFKLYQSTQKMDKDQNNEQNHILQRKIRKELTSAERFAVFTTLQNRSQHGRLQRGSVSDVARAFGVARATVSTLWNKGRQAMENGTDPREAILSKRGRCGQKKAYNDEDLISTIREMPLQDRRNLQDIANTTNVPLTSLHRAVQRDNGPLRAYTNAIKTHLTEHNKLLKVAWVRENMDDN